MGTKLSTRLRRLRERRDPNFRPREEDQPENHWGLEKAVKMYGYTGPMGVADITLASWNEFFREGGTLNQPAHLQTNRRKQIEKQFSLLARLHSPL